MSDDADNKYMPIFELTEEMILPVATNGTTWWDGASADATRIAQGADFPRCIICDEPGIVPTQVCLVIDTRYKRPRVVPGVWGDYGEELRVDPFEVFTPPLYAEGGAESFVERIKSEAMRKELLQHLITRMRWSAQRDWRIGFLRDRAIMILKGLEAAAK